MNLEKAKNRAANGIVFQPVVEKCEGCERIKEDNGLRHCTSYASRPAWTRKARSRSTP